MDADESFNGLCAKLTATLSGSGTAAPPVIIRVPVSEDELPSSENEDGILVVEVLGLCVGGASDPRATQVG